MTLVIIDENRREDVLKIKDMLNQGIELELIGTGFTSNVYKFNDLAIKVFKAENFDEKELSKFSLREAETMRRLQESIYTPSLIAFQEGKFIVMEYIDGILLADIKDEKILSSVSQHVNLFKEECILADIYTDDLNNRNVLIKNNEEIVFIDFGYYEVGGIDDDDE